MKTLLVLTFFLTTCFSPSLYSDEIVELEPFIVKARPMGYWDFSLLMHPVESYVQGVDHHVADYEVLNVLKGGTADRFGLQTGDRIYEINGKEKWLKSEVTRFLRYGEVGDQVHLIVRKLNSEMKTIEVTLLDNPLDDYVISNLNGIEVRYPWNSQIMVTNGGQDFYCLSKMSKGKEGKIFAKNILITRLSDPKYFKTLLDQKTHRIKKNRYIEFDEDLNYKILRK